MTCVLFVGTLENPVGLDRITFALQSTLSQRPSLRGCTSPMKHRSFESLFLPDISSVSNSLCIYGYEWVLTVVCGCHRPSPPHGRWFRQWDFFLRPTNDFELLHSSQHSMDGLTWLSPQICHPHTTPHCTSHLATFFLLSPISHLLPMTVVLTMSFLVFFTVPHAKSEKRSARCVRASHSSWLQWLWLRHCSNPNPTSLNHISEEVVTRR